MTMKVFPTTALICLIILPIFYTAEARQQDHRLTCEYFDSLNNNPKICSHVNMGRKINLENEKTTNSLYTAALKAMDSGDYRKQWRKDKLRSKGEMSFSVWMVDLNQDGIEEAIVFPTGDFYRGASGNGDIFILATKSKKESKQWKLLGIHSGASLYIEPQKTNDYFNVISQYSMSAYEGYLTRYKMNKNTGRYEKVIEREYRDCIIESQGACFRLPKNFSR